MDLGEARLLFDERLQRMRDPGMQRAHLHRPGRRWTTNHHRPPDHRPSTGPRDIRAITRTLAVQLTIDQLLRVGKRASVASGGSLFSVLSWKAAASVASAWSAFSVGSLGSVGSAGSILSIGSAGSILSVGSAGSILSIGSAGSILTLGGGSGNGEPEPAVPPAEVRRLSRLMALGALAAAWRGPRRRSAA